MGTDIGNTLKETENTMKNETLAEMIERVIREARIEITDLVKKRIELLNKYG